MIAKLESPPADAYGSLPEWARKLIWAHAQFEIDLSDLEPFRSSEAASGDTDGLVISFEGTSLELLPGGQSVNFVATPRVEEKVEQGEWDRPRVTDYWDARVGAIETAADHLAKLKGEKCAAALEAIRVAVEERATSLGDADLVAAAMSLFDDLYKTASSIGYWSEGLGQYIEASAGTFCAVLSERGFRVQYLIDNAWSDMSRPIQLFPDWFGSAGIGYVCPQALVLQQALEADPSMDTDTSELMSRHIDQARETVKEAVATYQDEGFHFVQLDTDMVDTSFETAIGTRGDRGVLTIYRSEAPEPGSRISVWTPEGVQLPTTGGPGSAKPE